LVVAEQVEVLLEPFLEPMGAGEDSLGAPAVPKTIEEQHSAAEQEQLTSDDEAEESRTEQVAKQQWDRDKTVRPSLCYWGPLWGRTLLHDWTRSGHASQQQQKRHHQQQQGRPVKQQNEDESPSSTVKQQQQQ
jgi:hypothetical protein